MTPIKTITVQDLQTLMKNDETTLIVGVFNGIQAFESHKIDGAMSLAELKGTIASLDRNTRLVFYSTTNNHDFVLRTAKQVTDYGFFRVLMLDGGWSAWKKQMGMKGPLGMKGPATQKKPLGTNPGPASAASRLSRSRTG